MDWLICIILGHDYMYQCDMNDSPLANIRKCKTCGKEQEGTWIYPERKLIWTDRKNVHTR